MFLSVDTLLSRCECFTIAIITVCRGMNRHWKISLVSRFTSMNVLHDTNMSFRRYLERIGCISQASTFDTQKAGDYTTTLATEMLKQDSKLLIGS